MNDRDHLSCTGYGCQCGLLRMEQKLQDTCKIILLDTCSNSFIHPYAPHLIQKQDFQVTFLSDLDKNSIYIFIGKNLSSHNRISPIYIIFNKCTLKKVK